MLIVSRSARSILALFVSFAFAVCAALPAVAQDDDEDSGDAWYEQGSTAVKQLNGRVVGQYVFARSEPAAAPQDTGVSAWTIAGALTTPLPGLDQFGSRVSIFGGQTAFRSAFGPVFDDDIWGIGANFELFWRDPELGTVEIGYSIFHTQTQWRNIPDVPAITENIQTFSLGGTMYLEDFDVFGSFAVSPRTAALITQQNLFTETGSRTKGLSAVVGPRYYVQDWLALDAEFGWRRTVAPFSLDGLNEFDDTIVNTYEGSFGIQTQLPTIGRGPIILSLFGGVGGSVIEPPLGIPQQKQFAWNVGTTVWIVFPRPDSIKQWIREYR